MAPQVEVALGADGRVDLVAVADHPVADGLFPEPAVEVDLVSAHVEHREVRVDAGHQEWVDHVFVDVSEDLQNIRNKLSTSPSDLILLEQGLMVFRI